MATTQTVGQLIAGGLIRRFKRDDGAWLVSFAAPTGPRIYNSLYRHPDSTADPEEESLIVLQNARKSVEWAIDHFLASRSDECPMCGKKAIELTEQARIAELENALRRISAGGLCECDHSDDNCCEKVGEFCDKCIADVALRGRG